MLQALELNPSLFEFTSTKLQKDFDIVVTTVANWYDTPQSAIFGSMGDFLAVAVEDLESFFDVNSQIQAKLQDHEIFTKCILPGIKF